MLPQVYSYDKQTTSVANTLGVSSVSLWDLTKALSGRQHFIQLPFRRESQRTTKLSAAFWATLYTFVGQRLRV